MTVPAGVDPKATCPGCGHLLRDHYDAAGALVGIPVETTDVDPAACFAGQSARERLWDEHDRGFVSDTEYAAAIADLDVRGE